MFQTFEEFEETAAMAPPTSKKNKVSKPSLNPTLTDFGMSSTTGSIHDSNSCYTNCSGDVIELGQILGQGTYGKVHLGLIDGIDPIVVKISDVASETRMEIAQNEATKLKDLGLNEFIPFFFNSSIIDNKMYLEIAQCGVSLHDLHSINKDAPFELKKVCVYAASMMEALDFLRSKDLVPGIKCGNVCVSQRFPYKLKIIDFGGAMYSREIDTVLGRLFTVAYMSPEALLRLPISFATDVWSASVIIFRMLVGQLPFPFAQREDLFVAFDRYKLLPSHASQSSRYGHFIMNVNPTLDWYESKYGCLYDDALEFRSKDHFLSKVEEDFCRLVNKLFDPEPSTRIQAAECAKMLRDFAEQYIK